MNGVATGVFTGDTLLGLNNAPWVDWSEQATYVGWSTISTKVVKYKKIGNVVYVLINLIGTSNSTSTNITLPFLIAQNSSNIVNIAYGENSGTGHSCVGTITNFTIDFSRLINGASNPSYTATWTNTGTKRITGQFFYETSQ